MEKSRKENAKDNVAREGRMLDQAQEQGLLPSKEGIDTKLKKRDLGGGMKDYIFE